MEDYSPNCLLLGTQLGFATRSCWAHLAIHRRGLAANLHSFFQGTGFVKDSGAQSGKRTMSGAVSAPAQRTGVKAVSTGAFVKEPVDAKMFAYGHAVIPQTRGMRCRSGALIRSRAGA